MSDQSSTDPPLPCPPRLDHLPTELLIRISLLLDHSSALSFALTSRAFTLPAREQIQRHLDLSLHPHYGELPLEIPAIVLPALSERALSFLPWRMNDGPGSFTEKRAGEELYKAALEDKTKRMFEEVNMGLVESVTTVTRLRTAPTILRILERVAPSLKGLTFRSPPNHLDDFVVWEPWSQDGLELRMIDAALSFPFLTHIRLSRRAIGHAEFIPLLCNASPLLEELDIELDQYLAEVREEGSQFPVFDRMTQIKRLRLAFKESHSRHSDREPDTPRWHLIRWLRMKHELYHCHCGEDEDCFHYSDHRPYPEPTLLSLLQHAPLLRQVSLEHLDGSSRTPWFFESAIRILRKHSHLMDIRSPGYMESFHAREKAPPGDYFPSLRRMALIPGAEDFACGRWKIARKAYLYIAIHIKRSRIPRAIGGEVEPCPPPDADLPLAVRPEFAAHLRQTPRLRVIYFTRSGETARGLDIFTQLDELDRSGHSTFLIRSFRHGSEELLRIRLFTFWEEISDVEQSAEAEVYSQRWRTLRYTARDGTRRIKLYERRDEPVVRYLTDFDGLAVPLEVVREMKRVEGVIKEMSEGRGVDVGAEAWKVLTDWRDWVFEQGRWTAERFVPLRELWRS